jgi:hypothetical protein
MGPVRTVARGRVEVSSHRRLGPGRRLLRGERLEDSPVPGRQRWAAGRSAPRYPGGATQPRATPRLSRDAYRRAIALIAIAVERAELERRLGALG